jgi:flavin-dependent dehydrogenase
MPNLHATFRSAPLGATLLEVALVVTLLTSLSFAGLHGFSRLRDRWAVQGARAALAELIRETRVRAVARGGARVVLSAANHEARLEASGVVLRRLLLREDFAVVLDLGGREEVELVFDASGVGRLASRSIGLARGGAQARIVVSSYGRVR